MKVNRISLMSAMALFALAGSFKIFAAPNSSTNASNSTQAQGSASNYAQVPTDPAERDAYFARTIEASFGPTKKIEVTDAFYNNIVAFTIIVPKDWFFEGTIMHGPGCNGLDYQSLVYRAYSSDAAFGVQSVPRQTYFYWEDQLARAQGPACKFFAPISAADYAAMFTYRSRPNAQIDRSEPPLD